MRLFFLGTGDAFCGDGRANTSIFVEGGHRILLDCSPQAVYNLKRLGYKVSDIEYIFLTHLHGDHAGGLPFVVLTLRFREQGRIIVSGPSGTREFAEKIYNAYYGIGGIPGSLEFRSLGDSFPFELSYMPAEHPVEAYVLKITMEGKTVVYTGDTARLDLSGFARRANLLVHEAAETDEVRAKQYGHSTPVQAANAAAEAKVEKLALVHRPALDDDTIRRVRSIFPNTALPNDLDLIRI